MLTELCAADPNGLRQAAALLRDGQVVAFPTETVYGLGADARQDRAVAEIFAAKGRPGFNPLIVHVAEAGQADELVQVDGRARALMDAFWPGPLTLVLPRRPGSPVSLLVSAGLESVAVRLPAHPVARDLIRAADCPVAAPSANRSGSVSPTAAAHVQESLGGRIPLIVDGGSCPVGVESTVLDLTGPRIGLLRPGGIAAEQIEEMVGQPLLCPYTDDHAPKSPGMLTSHYAPRARVRLNATSPLPDELLLGFGPVQGNLNLSPVGDLAEAAANLFAMLRQLDSWGSVGIAVAPIPDHHLGQAINDRLRRAAAPLTARMSGS